MTELVAGWINVLADWSLRWGLLILGLVAVVVAGLPRSVAARLWLARLVLIGGLLLPVLPHWWNAPWPNHAESSLAMVAQGSADGSVNLVPISAHGVATNPPPFVGTGVTKPSTGNAAASTTVLDWRVIAAWAWLIGCGFYLVRQAAGWWWLARIRRAAAPIQGTMLRELQVVRDEIGVGRPVEFLVSSEVAGPALFVGTRPAIVVPTDWPSWSVADRRAALLHELTHVANFDDWSGIAEEIVRAVFFFHPIVRWLLVRLAHDREQRCDAAVVRRGVAPRQLAQLLLDGVRRLGPGRSVLAATPMFNRSSAKERIHQLLEADMNRWSKPLSRARAAWVTAAVIGLCAGLGGYGASADPPPDKASGRIAEAEFHGTVSDSNGRRIPDVTVLAVGDMGNGERLTTTSDGEGQFAFDKLPVGKTAFPNVLVIAAKDGFAPKTMNVDPSKVKPTAITLPAATAYRGSVEDAAGRPVAGAEVQVGFVHRSGNGKSWGFEAEAAIRGTPAERVYFVTTNAAGRFEFATLAAGSELIFRVKAKGFAELNSGAGGPKAQHIVEDGAAPAKLVLGPEAIVHGRVLSDVPGLSPEAAVVKLEGTKALHGFKRGVKPDVDGQFTAGGLPAGPISVALELPPDAKGTAAGEAVITETGKTSDISLKIISGVEVSGRVVVRDSKEPVAGVHMATVGLVNPSSFHWAGKPTDAAGRFSLRLPPGKVTVMVWRTPGNYRQTDNRRQEIEVPADAAEFEMPQPFEVGKVVDVAAVLGRADAPVGGDQPVQPAPVAAERQAAAIVRQVGGWYVLDGDGHVVEVNMVYHEDPGGRRLDNRLIDSDGGLRAAGRFPRLRRLYLCMGQATDDGLAALVGLADLEAVYVWDAAVLTDAGVAHLAALPNLHEVGISRGHIGDASLAVFGKIPTLQSLRLQGTSVSDDGLKHLAGMTQLTSLSVGMSKLPITDAGARHLAGLTALRQLDLQGSRLTTAGVGALRNLTQLQSLLLSGPKDGDTLGDAAVEPLLGMKKLQTLSLGNTRLTANGVCRLTALPNLRMLSVASPAITIEERANLKKERPGVRLYFSGPASGR